MFVFLDGTSIAMLVQEQKALRQTPRHFSPLTRSMRCQSIYKHGKSSFFRVNILQRIIRLSIYTVNVRAYYKRTYYTAYMSIETHDTHGDEHEKLHASDEVYLEAVLKIAQIFGERDAHALDARIDTALSRMPDAKELDRYSLELDAFRLFAKKHGNVLDEMYRDRYMTLLSEHIFDMLKEMDPMDDIIGYYAFVREMFLHDELFALFPDAGALLGKHQEDIYARADLYRKEHARRQ